MQVDHTWLLMSLVPSRPYLRADNKTADPGEDHNLAGSGTTLPAGPTAAALSKMLHDVCCSFVSHLFCCPTVFCMIHHGVLSKILCPVAQGWRAVPPVAS